MPWKGEQLLKSSRSCKRTCGVASSTVSWDPQVPRCFSTTKESTVSCLFLEAISSSVSWGDVASHGWIIRFRSYSILCGKWWLLRSDPLFHQFWGAGTLRQRHHSRAPPRRSSNIGVDRRVWAGLLPACSRLGGRGLADLLQREPWRLGTLARDHALLHFRRVPRCTESWSVFVAALSEPDRDPSRPEPRNQAGGWKEVR